MAKIVNCPIDIPSLKRRRRIVKRWKLSSLAKKNPNFKLAAFQTIHKAKLNERLLQTLQRNDVDRPKVIHEKDDIFRHYEPNFLNIPEVKRTVRDELKKRKQSKYSSYTEAYNNYLELLEYIHTRYNPKREDAPERAIQLNAIDQKIIFENNMLRLPVELERRFLEILYVIIVDSWEIPVSYQWIELLNFLNAFTAES